MDRNFFARVGVGDAHVALRKESVDRNHRGAVGIQDLKLVALRKESVDRNMRQIVHIHTEIPSLSARRAWIEMLMWYQCNTVVKVALRKESVDRNIFSANSSRAPPTSLSARRAWIEMLFCT